MGAPELLHLRKATLNAAGLELERSEVHILGLLEEYYGIIFSQTPFYIIKSNKLLLDYLKRLGQYNIPSDNNILVVMMEKPLREVLVHISEVEELKEMPVQLLCESQEELAAKEGAHYLCSFCPLTYDDGDCEGDRCGTAYQNYVEEYYDSLTDLIISSLGRAHTKEECTK